MSTLYFIPCRFQPEQSGPTHSGFAVCSDADTPVTFLYPDGSAYPGTDIWTYRLLHFKPWSKLENNT